MDLEEYARIYVATYGRAPGEFEAVLATFGRTREWFEQAREAVDARARMDPRVAAEVNARVIIAGSMAVKAALPAPAVARHVRTRRCVRCGGHKRTVPRTAYIYCDYCGVFFDYDEDLARQRKGGVDVSSVLRTLVDGTRAEMVRAREAHDDEAYRRAWRWPYEMDMLLCPENWSPRIGDPAYRKAMVDFCVETCLIHNRDEKRRDAAHRRDDAQEAAMLAPSERTLSQYLERVHEVLSVEEASYRMAGLFDVHPDHLDSATFHRINVVLSVLGWSGALSVENFGLLLRLAKIQTDAVLMDPVGIGQASCGACGGHLLVVQGARNVVCEACGQTLDCRHAYPCASCGAHLLVSPGAASARCAWCGTVLTMVLEAPRG